MNSRIPTAVAIPVISRPRYSQKEMVDAQLRMLEGEQDEQSCCFHPLFHPLVKTKQDKIWALSEVQKKLTDSTSPIICSDKDMMKLCSFKPTVINQLRRGLRPSRTSRMMDSMYLQAESEESYFVASEAKCSPDEFKKSFLKAVQSGDYALVNYLLNVFATYSKEFSDVFEGNGTIYNAIQRQFERSNYMQRRDNIILLLFKNLPAQAIEDAGDGLQLLLTLMTAPDIKDPRGQIFRPAVEKLCTEAPGLFCRVDERQNTLLHLLAMDKNVEQYLEFLLELMNLLFPKAVNSQNSEGNTILHLLLLNQKEELYELAKYVQILTEYMTPEAMSAKNNIGETPIHLLLKRRNDGCDSKEKAFNLLLENMTPDAREFKYEKGKTIQELREEERKYEAEASRRSESSSPWWDYWGTSQGTYSTSNTGDHGGGGSGG
ncbi:MAG: hypothetical protein V4591_00615 [Bdellovibrionota bacterium]